MTKDLQFLNLFLLWSIHHDLTMCANEITEFAILDYYLSSFFPLLSGKGRSCYATATHTWSSIYLEFASFSPTRHFSTQCDDCVPFPPTVHPTIFFKKCCKILKSIMGNEDWLKSNFRWSPSTNGPRVNTKRFTSNNTLTKPQSKRQSYITTLF